MMYALPTSFGRNQISEVLHARKLGWFKKVHAQILITGTLLYRYSAARLYGIYLQETMPKVVTTITARTVRVVECVCEAHCCDRETVAPYFGRYLNYKSIRTRPEIPP